MKSIKQQTLAAFEQFGKPTRRAKFLADMEQILPSAEVIGVIERSMSICTGTV